MESRHKGHVGNIVSRRTMATTDCNEIVLDKNKMIDMKSE
jgi:hypothetical protein